MHKDSGKNIQQSKGMMNAKFRIVVTSGGGVEWGTKGLGRGTWGTSEVWLIFSFLRRVEGYTDYLIII